MIVKLTKNEMKYADCSESIRRFRNEICYTQEYMANQLGIAQSTYQRIETGEIKVSTDRLIEISKVLEKPFESFFKNHSKSVTNDSLENDQIINISKLEWELLQKILAQQENRIEELEAKIIRKNQKIEELKQILVLK